MAAAATQARATFSINPPADYLLRRDACSYGYFLLEPNHWEPATRTFSRVLDVGTPSSGESKVVRLDVRQPSEKRGGALRVTASAALNGAERAVARAALTRMLNLHEGPEVLREFHGLDPRWRRLGRGRLFRSPTLFEDVIKTVTSCNVTWPSTVSMNRRLCEVIGPDGSFPTAAALARTRPQLLRSRCGVGYRDERIVRLARMFDSGEIDPAVLEDRGVADEEVYARVLEWPGIGPYAAANIMQLLGRYGHLPLDSESLRHGRSVLGMRGKDRAVLKRLGKHYAGFGAHRFRSYWFELWDFYEAKRGRSWTWQKAKTAATFTAAKLKS